MTLQQWQLEKNVASTHKVFEHSQQSLKQDQSYFQNPVRAESSTEDQRAGGWLS